MLLWGYCASELQVTVLFNIITAMYWIIHSHIGVLMIKKMNDINTARTRREGLLTKLHAHEAVIVLLKSGPGFTINEYIINSRAITKGVYA